MLRYIFVCCYLKEEWWPIHRHSLDDQCNVFLRVSIYTWTGSDFKWWFSRRHTIMLGKYHWVLFWRIWSFFGVIVICWGRGNIIGFWIYLYRFFIWLFVFMLIFNSWLWWIIINLRDSLHFFYEFILRVKQLWRLIIFTWFLGKTYWYE